MRAAGRVARLLLPFLLAGEPLVAQQTRHAVIVVLDGMRFSETFGNSSHQYIPRMGSLLVQQGVLYTAYYSDGVTQTCSGHASLLTGTWQVLDNTGAELPHAPTLFEYYRQQTQTSATDNFVVLGKRKLAILACSDDPAYGGSYAASVRTSSPQYGDSAAFESFRAVMTDHHPRLAVMNLPETDSVAHTGDWSGYLSAIRRADSLVGEIWNFIQSDAILKDRTTLFVTNDHGRHLDGVSGGFAGHGDGCDGCRHLMLLVLGPDTPAGVSSAARHTLIDIAPTIGALLKFGTPRSGGVPLGEVITGVREKPQSIPGRTELLQNYPNPFNPTTMIRYYLGSPAEARLVLYDLLGGEVVSLAEGYREAGWHDVSLDGSDLASGVYVYRLSAGNSVLARAMVHLK